MTGRRDYGTGGITKLGPNRWQLQVRLGKDPATGKAQKHYENVRGTKRDAQKRLNELLCQAETGIDIAAEKITVAEWLERWLRDFATPKVSARTVATYSQTVGIFTPLIG